MLSSIMCPGQPDPQAQGKHTFCGRRQPPLRSAWHCQHSSPAPDRSCPAGLPAAPQLLAWPARHAIVLAAAVATYQYDRQPAGGAAQPIKLQWVFTWVFRFKPAARRTNSSVSISCIPGQF